MGKRRESREQIEARIIELGRRQLVDGGAAALSVRAIARDLGMVSSAVYRYVSSRDELLTLLLIDAYSDLADTVDRARESVGDLWSDDVVAIASSVTSGGTRRVTRRRSLKVPGSRSNCGVACFIRCFCRAWRSAWSSSSVLRAPHPRPTARVGVRALPLQAW